MKRFFNNNNNKKGFTILELMVVSIIFSLFLIAVYTVFDTGIKAWNMGNVRTDLQNSGQIVIRRMVKELMVTSQHSLTTDISGYNTGTEIVHQYIGFETPIKDADFSYRDDNFGSPLWQGAIVYYVLPQNSNEGNLTLYRRYITYNPGGDPDFKGKTMPAPITNIESKLITAVSSPYTQPVPIAENIDSFDVTRTEHIVDIKIVYKKQLSDREANSPHYSVAGTSDKGEEYFELRASVEPKN